ncbi:MAG: hypothetical protein M5T61_08410 [Acidimicrobiia bacterium]|nr:hypothetical protein [Acidimicrobiia bacterium]
MTPSLLDIGVVTARLTLIRTALDELSPYGGSPPTAYAMSPSPVPHPSASSR